ncbi:MAG: sugar phosphate isomerase/epimerase [Chloroflexi bacterium]|nr:sugar phosphate isomerase/epimerase [Chloroflexota bacterium]
MPVCYNILRTCQAVQLRKGDVKLAYTIATPEVPRLSLGWAGDAGVICRELAEVGYQGVELQVRDPALFDGAKLRRTITEAGLDIAAVSTGQIAEEGFHFTSPDEQIRRRAIERFGGALRLAAEYGVDVSIGSVRGQVGWAPSRDKGIDWLRGAIEKLLGEAARLGVRIVLEPQLRLRMDYLNTIDEAVAFARSFGSDQLVIEADTYHMAAEEQSLPAAIVRGRSSGLVTYFQLADSNRLAPGLGHLNWVDIIETIKATGYDGWLSIECLQRPDSRRCAEQALRYVGALI